VDGYNKAMVSKFIVSVTAHIENSFLLSTG